MTSPASVRGFNLKNHEELKKNSQLIEKWHRFSLGGCEKSHPPGTDRVKDHKMVWKVQDLNPWLNLDPFYHSKNVIFKSNFHTEAVKSRGFWLYVGVVPKPSFWMVKVSALLTFTKIFYRLSKFRKKGRKLQIFTKFPPPGFEPWISGWKPGVLSNRPGRND